MNTGVSLSAIIPTLSVTLCGIAVCDLIICQVDRLGLALARQFEERSDMAVVQLAGELQVSIDEHADAPAQKLHSLNRRPELPGLLSSVADIVQAALTT